MKIIFLNTFTVITLVCLTIMFIEFSYSIYRKDGIYSITGTTGNFLDYIVTNFISNTVSKFYFSYFFIWFTFFGYIYTKFNLLSFLICLLIVDFFFYILHYLKHKINFLWTFHYVHHSDNKFNMSTFLRASWVEQLFLMTIPLVPPLLLGFNPYIIILVSYTLFIFQFFVHSQYIKFPHITSYMLITPQLHAIHHDQVTKHQNSNFGSMFSIWDRLFGTFIDKIDTFTPGIKGYQQDNFILMQTDPIIKYIKNV